MMQNQPNKLAFPTNFPFFSSSFSSSPPPLLRGSALRLHSSDMGSGPENRKPHPFLHFLLSSLINEEVLLIPYSGLKRGLSTSQPETPSAASKRTRPAGLNPASSPQGHHSVSQSPPQPEAQQLQPAQHKPEKAEGILHDHPEEDSEENGVSAPQEGFGLASAHPYAGAVKGGKERERERDGEEPRDETREHNWRTGQKYFDEEEHVAQIMVKVERQREKFTGIWQDSLVSLRDLC